MAGEQAVYLRDLYEAEQYVAWRIRGLAEGELVPPPGLDRLIGKIQSEQGLFTPLSSVRPWSWRRSGR